jgi:hypothetical protein
MWKLNGNCVFNIKLNYFLVTLRTFGVRSKTDIKKSIFCIKRRINSWQTRQLVARNNGLCFFQLILYFSEFRWDILVFLNLHERIEVIARAAVEWLPQELMNREPCVMAINKQRIIVLEQFSSFLSIFLRDKFWASWIPHLLANSDYKHLWSIPLVWLVYISPFLLP